VNRQERPAPGTVGLRLAGSPEDTGTLISVLERLAAGLPVTTVRLEILHRSGARANLRGPGEWTYVLVRVTAAGTGASGSGSTP
jgi:hypothetical protein